ncbi:MAG TPA: transglycosylase domain-containing protein [Solirubrobacteraceae bacterium]|nr:transglycosylase domain-containing protein [Solirubrobacteraceae bacterium]
MRPLVLALGGFFTLVAVTLLGIVGYVIAVAASAPSLSSLQPVPQGESSAVYAADGQRLGFIQSPILRTPIASSAIPLAVKQATVAIEDRRFYAHKGVDFEGIVRAAMKNLQSHETVQGGSTLTMQLIKNLYPREDGKRDYKVKIREAKLAEELENEHPGRVGKDWILTKYLNSVPYGTAGGQEAVGIQAAARIFFNKPASQLTLSEAALLAGLPQAPTQYNPRFQPAAALRRRNEVLDQMVRAKSITPAQAAEAKAEPPGLAPSHYYTERREGYFFDYVISELTRRYGADTVQKGGLRIYTTLDLRKQRAARAAMAKGIAGTDRDAAIVSIDPQTGYIRAMAPSRNYGELKFNLATQGGRPAGSTFKVMVLMTALERGVDPVTTSYTSMPLKFFDRRTGREIDVKTYDNTYKGRINLVRATLSSDNSVYQQLDLDLGPKEVAETARKMGITSKLNGYPSEGLGAIEDGVSPLEMARAYATIASGGYRTRPTSVTKVVFPDGHSETPFQPQRTKVFSDGVAYEATKILEQNVKGGTGVPAATGCPAAGKTGTTDDFTDAWFVGYTPKLSTAVWVGHAGDPKPMPGASGSAAAAPIWGAYMKTAKGGYCGEFPQPTTAFQPRPFNGLYMRYGTAASRMSDDGTSSPFPQAQTQTTPTQPTPGATTAPSQGTQTTQQGTPQTQSTPAGAVPTPVPTPNPGGAGPR